MPPGNPLIKPVAAFKPPKPKPVVGPQNVGLVGGGLGGYSNPGSVAGIPLALPGAPAAAAPAPVAAPPPDFNALINADPNYITAKADRDRQNALALHALQQGFAQTAQGYQDNANAHGALFSGAAVNAQTYAAQQSADQQAQQAANYAQGGNQDRTSAWQRILQQLAGGS